MTGDNPTDSTVPRRSDLGLEDLRERLFGTGEEDTAVAQVMAGLLHRPRETTDEAAAREALERTLYRRIFGEHVEEPVRQMIGRYRLERGDSPSVSEPSDCPRAYKAHDPKLERPVVLTRVARVEPGPSLEALISAIRAAVRVRHPNVVEVYDYVHYEGEIYIVTPELRGVTLGRWLVDRRRTWKEIVSTFINAGQGLVVLHEHGIHGGFTPSRVIVEPSGHVQVVEFIDGDRGAGRGRESHQADRVALFGALYQALFSTPALDHGAAAPRAPVDRKGVPRSIVRLVMEGLESEPRCRRTSMAELLRRLSVRVQPRRCLQQASVAFMVGACLSGGLCIGMHSSAPAWTPTPSPAADKASGGQSLARPTAWGVVTEPAADPRSCGQQASPSVDAGGRRACQTC